MNVFEAMLHRRSIRKYQPKLVDDKLIGVLLFFATHGPTAGNTKDWRFIVVKNKERKEKLYKAALHQSHVRDAPICIVVCSDLEAISLRYGKRGELVYALEDCAAAIQNMLLAATALGLGSCWVGAFDEEEVKSILGLPDFVRPIAILTIGYPAEEPSEKKIDYSSYCYLEIYGKRYEFEFRTLERLLKEALEKLKEKKPLVKTLKTFFRS